MPNGLKLVVYGGEGIGKTDWARQFGILGPVDFVSCGESGLTDLQEVNPVEYPIEDIVVESYEGLLKATKSCEAKTFVVDALSGPNGVQELIFDYVCRKLYNGNWDDFKSYWGGQRTDSPKVLAEWLAELTILRNKGTNIILIGHMITTTLPNTLGADYLSHVLDMDMGDKGHGMRSLVTKWAQAILFMNIDVAITLATETDKKRRVVEGKAKDDDCRLMYTTKTPGHSAKNRLGLPPLINMGESAKEAFTNFWKQLPDVYQDTL